MMMKLLRVRPKEGEYHSFIHSFMTFPMAFRRHFHLQLQHFEDYPDHAVVQSPDAARYLTILQFIQKSRHHNVHHEP